MAESLCSVWFHGSLSRTLLRLVGRILIQIRQKGHLFNFWPLSKSSAGCWISLVFGALKILTGIIAMMAMLGFLVAPFSNFIRAVRNAVGHFWR